MSFKKIFLYLSLTTVLITPPYLLGDECSQIRAAFDVGSESSKLTVARVDTCTQTIIEILHRQDIRVPYKSSLDASPDQRFSADVMQRGEEALRHLLAAARQHGAEVHAGGATSAFRQAGNAGEFIEEMNEKLQLNIQIVSQAEEGALGFIGAARKFGAEPRDAIVWDIGGGSMQITAWNEKQQVEVYQGEIASIDFKNTLINRIQGHSLTKVTTPNPIDAATAKAGIHQAWTLAAKDVPVWMKAKIVGNTANLVGIGGVWYYSIRGQLEEAGQFKDKLITLAALRATIDHQLGKTDAEIGGDYADTQVSNLLLVTGFMQALGVSKITPLKVSLVEGVLVKPSYWQLEESFTLP